MEKRSLTVSKMALAIAAASVFSAGIAGAAVLTPGYTGGVTTDIFDVAQGAQLIYANSAEGSDPINVIGGNGTSPETGNSFLGPNGAGLGSTYFFRTANVVNFSGYSLGIGSENPARSLDAATVSYSLNNISWTSLPTSNLVGAQPYPGSTLSDSFASVQAQYFRLNYTQHGAPVRISEFDGTGSSTGASYTGVRRDPITFNLNNLTAWAGASGVIKQPAGLVNPATITNSATLNFGSGPDSVAQLFGDQVADNVESKTSTIFDGGGVADNGNTIMGDGGENVDFIQWSTTSAVSLAGYALESSSSDRKVELLKFWIDGVAVDTFDTNGSGGTLNRLFGADYTGSTFKLEFTRSGDGPRLIQVDAILSAVPEPTGLGLLGIAGVFAMRRRHRRV